jgi:hypothetical protein
MLSRLPALASADQLERWQAMRTTSFLYINRFDLVESVFIDECT